MIFLMLFLTSTFTFHLCIFPFKITFLTIMIFHTFHFSIAVPFILLLIYTLISFKYLRNTEVNINNILIMTGDFNIRDCLWDPSYLFHSSYKDTFFEIANSFHVELSIPTGIFPTRYSNNTQDINSVLDLRFLRPNSMKYDNYHIYSE